MQPVGSMEPSIEIWDLDTINEVEPSLVLGGVIEKKKKKKGKKYEEYSHTDSVLGLAWNKEFRNILGSASSDKRVKIWDVAIRTSRAQPEHSEEQLERHEEQPERPEAQPERPTRGTGVYLSNMSIQNGQDVGLLKDLQGVNLYLRDLIVI